MTPDPHASQTLEDIVERSIAAHRNLASVAEAVEDESQFVADLVAVYEARLRAWLTVEPAAPVDPGARAAVAAAIDETHQITDPHRAIDWLSTFPHVVGLALGRRP